MTILLRVRHCDNDSFSSTSSPATVTSDHPLLDDGEVCIIFRALTRIREIQSLVMYFDKSLH